MAAVAPAALDVTLISLIVQWVGILVVAGLLLFLTQSIRSRALDAWAAAWCCLAVALAALYYDFRRAPPHHALRGLYFLGEYGFGFLLLAGCRAFASARPARAGLTRRPWLWLPAGAVVAVGLTWVSDDFNVQFALHAAILAGLLLAAFLTLLPARAHHPQAAGGPGATVLCAALLLLALDFCHYVPVFAVAAARGANRRFAYLNYTSSVDLILEIVLGFGVVMVTMEGLRRDSERANRELQEALGRLEVLASTDPLTSALNRHAFQSLVAGEGGGAGPSDLAGCVAVADVDRLKRINDREGHAAGDLAIRRVATAIRSVIRADDLLFRWGGDEFLVILLQVDEHEARRRFARVNEILAEAAAAEPGGDREPPLSVSFGIAPFGRAAALEAAIELADAVMYERKRSTATVGRRAPVR